MPFENEADVKAYAGKINFHVMGVDILIRRTLVIFQPETIPLLNTALQNTHTQICDRIFLQDLNDLIRVLYAINAETFKNYFTRLEAMIANQEINFIKVATLIEMMLKASDQSAKLPLQCIPDVLLLLIKQVLKQLPKSEANNRAQEFATALEMIAQLATIIYRIEPTLCKNFTTGLAAVVHRGEITYYQLAVLIERLLDAEYKNKFSHEHNNTYLRSLNIITDLLITIIPEEDRSAFILIIFEQLFNFEKLISQFDLIRSAEGGVKFSMNNEKFTIIDGRNPQLNSLVKNSMVQLQELLDKLNRITAAELPPVIKMICQIIANNLSNNLGNTGHKEQIITRYISSFISNKLFGELVTKWVSKTFGNDSESLKAMTYFILKPIQALVTYVDLSEEHKRAKPLDFPEEIKQFVNAGNQKILTAMVGRILEENPPAMQQLARVASFSVSNIDSLLMAAPPINEVHENSGHGRESGDNNGKQKGVLESIAMVQTAVPALPTLAVATVTTLPAKPSAVLAVVVEKKYLDKEIDEQELILRLQIYYADCLALAVQLNVTVLLPSQTSGKIKALSSLVATPPEKVIPSSRKILRDIAFLKEALAQSKNPDKIKLLQMYNHLHSAIVSYEGYKAVIHVDDKLDRKIAKDDSGAPKDRRLSVEHAAKK